MPAELNWIITNDFGYGKDSEERSALLVKLKGTNYTAYIKWDGCCEITMVDSVKGENGLEDENMHICDIPRFIKVLQSLEDFRMKNIIGAE